jgi:hypothetical protein
MARGFRTRLKGLTTTTLDYLEDVVAGTSAASKAVVLGSNSKIDTIDITSLKVGGTTVGSTAAELNLLDLSAQTEAITVAGAVSVTKRYTTLNSTSGAYAVTLAAPDASMIGQVKVIEMTVDAGNNITLALTNVQGGSAATTATFADVNDVLVLVAGATKWHVIGESGVALS